MSKRKSRHRVALIASHPWSVEGAVLKGALAYRDQTGGWDVASGPFHPFIHIRDVDLSAVDGAIGVIYSQEWAEKLAAAGVAVVNCSCRFEETPFPRVITDDVEAGRMAAAHLIERGFTHFGFVPQWMLWFSTQRQKGFQGVIEQDPNRSFDFHAGPIDHVKEAESRLGQWLLNVPKPIGIMAANDRAGMATVEMARYHGFRVPEDVAVVGMDNDSWVACRSPVPLSSVEPDGWHIGYRAGQKLDRIMAGQDPGPDELVVPTGVIRRQSTDTSVTADPLVADAMSYIRAHCAEQLTVDDVLDELEVSRRSLELRMKKTIGQSPQVAIYKAQIERSKPMLSNSRMTMSEIGIACGIERPERFSRLFKRYTGMTPGDYRAQSHSGAGHRESHVYENTPPAAPPGASAVDLPQA